MNDIGILVLIGALVVLVGVWMANRYLLPWGRMAYSHKRAALVVLIGFVVANALVPQVISRDSVFLAAMIAAFAQFAVGTSTRGKDFGLLVSVAVVNVTYGSNLLLVLILSIWGIFWAWVDSSSESQSPKRAKQSKSKSQPKPSQAESAQRTTNVRAFLDRLNGKEQVDDDDIDFDPDVDVEALSQMFQDFLAVREAQKAADAAALAEYLKSRNAPPAPPAQRPAPPAPPAQPQPQAQPQPRPTVKVSAPPAQPTAPVTPLPWDDIEASDDAFDEDPFAEFEDEVKPSSPITTASQPPRADSDFEDEEWLGNPFPEDKSEKGSTPSVTRRKSRMSRAQQRREEEEKRRRNRR